MPKLPANQSAAGAPPTTISASLFKATCLELMDELAATGAELIVTKHGRPIVRVSPAHEVSRSPFGYLRGTIVRHGDIVSPDADAWESSPTDPLRTQR